MRLRKTTVTFHVILIHVSYGMLQSVLVKVWVIVVTVIAIMVVPALVLPIAGLRSVSLLVFDNTQRQYI